MVLGEPCLKLITAVDALAPDLEKGAATAQASELVQIAHRQARKLSDLFGGEVVV